MNCSRFVDMVRSASLSSWGCSEDGAFLRIETPFRYPDGGTVELFLEQRGPNLLVTDYGEAFRFLEAGGIDPARSPARQKAIDLATKLSNARLDEGALEIVVHESSELLAAVVRLGQAVTRVADLSLLAKGTFVSTFSDVVEEFLKAATHGIEIQRGAVVRGSATSHQVDILARSQQGVSVVESLSAITPTGANSQTAFTIQKFADISALGAGAPGRFAILDNSAEVWSDSLRKQLARFADVVDWEQRDELAAAIAPDA